MFHIMYHKNNDDKLIPNESIFPRPTPWIVAWQAFADYLRGRDTFCFVEVPTRYAHLLRYDLYVEGEEVLLREQGRDVIHLPVLPMAFLTWVFYAIESYAHGLLFQVWNHRLFAGTQKLTRQELMDKLDRLQAELDRLHTTQPDDGEA
jgi:hypothetical protein